MSGDSSSPKYLSAEQIVYLPRWARFTVMGILAILTVSACVAAIAFLFHAGPLVEKVAPLMSIAQAGAAAFAVVIFVLFAERQLSTKRLHQRTDEFLESQLKDSLARIELPQIKKGVTVKVNVLQREESVHGGRKDIYGANYDIHIENFKMRMWVGINVKRLSVIYFAKVENPNDVEKLRDVFRFTFSGAKSVGYDTNFEYVEIGGERLVSIWSTVLAEFAILGNPAEQLFWVQDVAMMTQSLARTALRKGVDLYSREEPGPL